MLAPGTQAPPLSLPDHRGGRFTLTEHLGSWVVLWWFPKAATSG